MTLLAAGAFVLLTLVVCGFQVALILGAPWGEFTLGGRWRGRLPMAGRLIAAASIGILALSGAVVAARAGLAFPELRAPSHRLVWVVVGYLVLGAIANAATPSRRERRIWLPVVTAMLALALSVALS